MCNVYLSEILYRNTYILLLSLYRYVDSVVLLLLLIMNAGRPSVGILVKVRFVFVFAFRFLSISKVIIINFLYNKYRLHE